MKCISCKKRIWPWQYKIGKEKAIHVKCFFKKFFNCIDGFVLEKFEINKMDKEFSEDLLESCYQCDVHFKVKAGRKCLLKNKWIWIPDHQIPDWCPKLKKSGKLPKTKPKPPKSRIQTNTKNL